MGLAVTVVVWSLARIQVHAASEGMENRNQSLRALFKMPLICSAALLSFAHGANDVAKQWDRWRRSSPRSSPTKYPARVAIPLWVMAIGAVGISVGLVLFSAPSSFAWSASRSRV